MPDITEAMVEAASRAMEDTRAEILQEAYYEGTWAGVETNVLARAALEAALPMIVEAQNAKRPTAS